MLFPGIVVACDDVLREVWYAQYGVYRLVARPDGGDDGEAVLVDGRPFDKSSNDCNGFGAWQPSFVLEKVEFDEGISKGANGRLTVV